MRKEEVQYFTDREENFTDLLTKLGIDRCVAKIIVFFAKTSEATSRDIERGTDLRQPQVSLAMKYFTEREWVKVRNSPLETKGRPIKVYEMVKSIDDIVDTIEKEKKKAAKEQLLLVKKIKDYIV